MTTSVAIPEMLNGTLVRCDLCGNVGRWVAVAPPAKGWDYVACADCQTALKQDKLRTEKTTIWVACRSCGQEMASASLEINHCVYCMTETWPPKNHENRQRMALLIGALSMMDAPARASEIRRWLGAGVTIWPWMLDELVTQGIATVDRSHGGRGFQKYALVKPLLRK